MTENTRENQTASVLTTQFLKDQVDSAKKELDGIEDRLQKFRQDNAGRLPGEVGNNWAQLNALETRIANINGAISRTSQDKLLLEAELRSLKNQMASLNTVPEQITMHTKSESLIMAEREVQLLEAQLSSLRERYRETYPDVQRAQAQLTTARKRRDDLIKEDEQRKSEMKPEQKRRFDPVLARDTQNVQTAIDRIEAQVKQKELQSTEYSRELAQVERLVGEVRAKIASTPVGEKEYAEIVRDREMAKLKYDDLNKKRSQSAIAEELVKRQQGESLEVLDPASLPQTPTQPKRPMIVAIGTGLGFVLGLFFAGAREAKDSSLKNLKDVRAYTQLTILGSVPLLENDLVVRRRRRLAWLAWSTACLVGIMIMTGSVFYYYMTKA
jgi:succinoglycan biosynthesis transport protein ExoP